MLSLFLSSPAIDKKERRKKVFILSFDASYQLVQLDGKEDAYICKAAKTPKEVQELIENGFEFICTMEDLRFFRKRK